MSLRLWHKWHIFPYFILRPSYAYEKKIIFFFLIFVGKILQLDFVCLFLLTGNFSLNHPSSSPLLPHMFPLSIPLVQMCNFHSTLSGSIFSWWFIIKGRICFQTYHTEWSYIYISWGGWIWCLRIDATHPDSVYTCGPLVCLCDLTVHCFCKKDVCKRWGFKQIVWAGLCLPLISSRLRRMQLGINLLALHIDLQPQYLG